jgi:hypothetical protein
MKKSKRKIILVITGVILLLGHMAIHHFTAPSSFTDFSSGFLLGIGVILIIAGLLVKKEKQI